MPNPSPPHTHQTPPHSRTHTTTPTRTPFQSTIPHPHPKALPHATCLCVEQPQGDADLGGQAPQLVEAEAQVDQAVGVHRHERLHPPAAGMRQRGSVDSERLAEDGGGDRGAQLAGDEGLAVAVVGAQEGLRWLRQSRGGRAAGAAWAASRPQPGRESCSGIVASIAASGPAAVP
jgi:hypothetical protein